MKLAFIDPIAWDYSVETPLERPLGGSQSALCYLAAELARQGHEVALVNRIADPGRYAGVLCTGWAVGATAQFLNAADAVVMLNGTGARRLREAGVRAPLVLWTQHSHDQRAIQGLQQVRERKAWTAFAFVSRWQAENYQRVFRIRPEASRVLHNCISPAFAALPVAEPWFVAGKPPILAYSSTPFRGLDVLLEAFPLIRAALPDVRLRIYSSMAVYGVRAEDDAFRAVYEHAARMDGVDYVGSLGQSRLAGEMAGIAALAYPSTFAETFCIAAAEALSLGALLLTTRLGALPELFAEAAAMMAPIPDRTALAAAFADLTIAALREELRDPAESAARRSARIERCRERFSWPARAREWASWLEQLRAT